MIRGLVRAVLLIIVIVAVVAFVIGYRWSTDGDDAVREPVVGTTGDDVDIDSAREVGAKIGERVAQGTNEAQRLATNAGITARIKSKMALDEIVEAADIDVDTTNGVVTLTGSVTSTAERDRAVQLARETEGVTSVVDRLTMR